MVSVLRNLAKKFQTDHSFLKSNKSSAAFGFSIGNTFSIHKLEKLCNRFQVMISLLIPIF